MLSDLEAGRIDTVISVDLDRLLRSTRDLATLLDLNAAVLTVDGEIDLTTADGEFRATMLAGIARFEVRRKSERQTRANDARVARGMPVAGGRRRFGFESDHLTPIPSEAEWIRTLYLRVSEGASLRSLAREMNAAGVKCVTKGEWNAARIRKILVNPAYRGMVIHHGKPWASDVVPTIVNPETAARVDAILADPTRKKSPGTERRALLGGLAICGTCGAPLVSAGSKYRGAAVATYACSAVKGGQTNGVGHPAVRRAILDRVVLSEVANAFLFGKDTLSQLPGSASLAAIDQELAALLQAKSDVLSLVGDDTHVTIADLRPRLEVIAQDFDRLSAKRGALLARDHQTRLLSEMQHRLLTGPEVSIRDVADLKSEVTAAFNRLELGTQRLLIATLLDVAVLPGRGPSRFQIRHKVVLSLNDE